MLGSRVVPPSLTLHSQQPLVYSPEGTDEGWQSGGLHGPLRLLWNPRSLAWWHMPLIPVLWGAEVGGLQAPVQPEWMNNTRLHQNVKRIGWGWACSSAQRPWVQTRTQQWCIQRWRFSSLETACLEREEYRAACYCHGFQNNILVNDELHIELWSHKIIIELKSSYHLGMS